jgi:hypothetical protein
LARHESTRTADWDALVTGATEAEARDAAITMLEMMMRDLSQAIARNGEPRLAARHLSATGRLRANAPGRNVTVRVDDAKWCAWPINVAA